MEDSPWDEDPNLNGLRDTEWTKISSEFTNVGYREGITAGKEAALQEGFDTGFADIGVPLGRAVGLARGIASAVSSILSTRAQGLSQELEVEVREILNELNAVQFSDIVPRDLEAEEHAKEHMEVVVMKEPQRTMDEVRMLQQRAERVLERIINK